MREAQKFVQRFIDAAAEKSRRMGKPVTCKAGCFHCCREPLTVELEEARLIVSTMSEAERAEVAPKVQAWWDGFFAGLHLEPSPIDMEAAAPGVVLYRYRAAMLWCPLLKDGLCGKYAVRPIGCRVHNVIGNPKHCADDDKRRKQLFMQTKEDAAVMSYAMGIQCQAAPKAFFAYDYLGVWLGHLLLGKTQRSAAARDLLITQREPTLKL